MDYEYKILIQIILINLYKNDISKVLDLYLVDESVRRSKFYLPIYNVICL